MSFNLIIGEKEVPKEYGRIERLAVRAVIRNGEQVLMILTNKGDYKFPGGGVKKDEEMELALERELLEETGYCLKEIKGILGETVQQNIDTYDSSKFFVMKSVYYECVIDESSQVAQKLDDYEAEQCFKPYFIPISKAIEINQSLLNRNDVDINPWVFRDTEVLKQL